jgi:isopentenyl-diphosphate delta-isomerase
MLSSRKADHLRICLQDDVRPPRPGTGLGRYRFVHQALPELDMSQIDLRTRFLGKALSAPMLVSAMTGGTDAGHAINRHLAEAVAVMGIGMSVGSQRVALEELRWASSFAVRDVAPDILLLANLGAAQLTAGYTVEHCQRAVDMIQADGLILHLNPLQEALQPGGDSQYAGLLSRIAQVCRALPVPVVVKEVGYGLSDQVAQQLAEAGVSALDTAGAGGTSWSQVERHRMSDPISMRVAAQFVDWGIPTADSIRMVRKGAPNLPLIASGGLVSGIDIAKCIALGADMAGLAWPLLRPAMLSSRAVVDELQVIVRTLRVAMLCIGAPTIGALRETDCLQEVRA